MWWLYVVVAVVSGLICGSIGYKMGMEATAVVAAAPAVPDANAQRQLNEQREEIRVMREQAARNQAENERLRQRNNELRQQQGVANPVLHQRRKPQEERHMDIDDEVPGTPNSDLSEDERESPRPFNR